MYGLEKNKERSQQDKVSYNLVRKESRDIDNIKMKINEFDHEKQRNNPISARVIAEDVKSMYIEYVGIKQQEKEEKKNTHFPSMSQDDEKEIRRFAWGDKEDTQGIVPKQVEVSIILWDDKFKKSHLFQAVFPLLSFPTLKENKKKEDKKNNSVSNPGQPSPSGQNGPGNQLPSGVRDAVSKTFRG